MIDSLSSSIITISPCYDSPSTSVEQHPQPSDAAPPTAAYRRLVLCDRRVLGLSSSANHLIIEVVDVITD